MATPLQFYFDDQDSLLLAADEVVSTLKTWEGFKLSPKSDESAWIFEDEKKNLKAIVQIDKNQHLLTISDTDWQGKDVAYIVKKAAEKYSGIPVVDEKKKVSFHNDIVVMLSIEEGPPDKLYIEIPHGTPHNFCFAVNDVIQNTLQKKGVSTHYEARAEGFILTYTTNFGVENSSSEILKTAQKALKEHRENLNGLLPSVKADIEGCIYNYDEEKTFSTRTPKAINVAPLVKTEALVNFIFPILKKYPALIAVRKLVEFQDSIAEAVIYAHPGRRPVTTEQLNTTLRTCLEKKLPGSDDSALAPLVKDLSTVIKERYAILSRGTANKAP